jgi:thioesterase-3
METTPRIFTYPTIIKEVDLDLFGHMNNAAYLSLFEEARWDLITKNGYGLQKIRDTQIGPTILEINIRFMRELHARDEIIVETQLIEQNKKIGRIRQRILRGGVECCVAEFVIALFSLKERKIIQPTEEWLNALI